MLQHYFLFLAETATLVVALLLLAAGFVGLGRRRGRGGASGIQITDLRQELHQHGAQVLHARLGRKSAKTALRKLKKQDRDIARTEGPCTYVLDFRGDLRASALGALREEISTLLAIRQNGDRVYVRLESGGGMVNAYGLAAAQLLRLRNASIPLTVLVDSVAASGGYLMAAVADEIVASPFAILGSIGVIAQVPNFHRWLRERHIDFEQFTAGRFKRTVSLFGENTEAGRQKLREDLENIHAHFRELVGRFRPQVDLEKVATGETWLGSQALELGLVDRLATSDAEILQAAETGRVLRLQHFRRQSLTQRLGMRAQGVWEGLWKPPVF